MSIFLEQIFSALQFLEKKGLGHHDVKPDNILIDKSGCMKLGDFGICEHLIPMESNATNNDNSSSKRERPPVRGTYAYLPPHCKSGTTDRDKWALTLVAYVMANGAHPFAALIGTPWEDAIPREFLNWKPDIRSEISNDLRKLILEL